MSEHWEFYPCQMGEHTAFIFYDHGLSETVQELSQSELLKVWLTIKDTNKEGLPKGDIFDVLSAFEDELTSVVEQANAVYVGRVTVDGNRVFYCYNASGEESLQAALQTIANRYGFEVDFRLSFDPDKEGYWKELFPTEDDWQVMKDMKVLDVLAKHGDDGTAERLVEHWAYFSEEDSAASFRLWLVEHGYQLTEKEVAPETPEIPAANAEDGSDPEEEAQFCIQFSHTGPVTLPEISQHTIKLRHQAAELHGDYDGWETVVCKTTVEE